MRKNFFLILLGFIFSAFPVCAFAQSSKSLWTTTPIAQNLTQALVGQAASVHTLLPWSADPHSYQARPKDLQQLKGALALIRLGKGMDDWADRMGSRSGVSVISLAATFEGGSNGLSLDPHFWLSTRQLARAAEGLSSDLRKLMPREEKSLEENLKKFTQQLDSLREKTIKDVEEVRTRGALAKVAVTHGSFFWLFQDLGLQSLSVESKMGQHQKSAQATAAFLQRMKEEKIGFYFEALGASPVINANMRKQFGVQLAGELFVDTLPEGSSSPRDLLKLIEKNHQIILNYLRTTK